EMAEHPGLMKSGEFELVGFSVGVVDKENMITGVDIAPGDAIIGLHSPGLRSNGYSLARKVFFDIAKKSITDPGWSGADATVGQELLLPSVIYTPTILEILEQEPITGIAHITGGGLPGNVNRVLPKTVDAEIFKEAWEPPRVFTEIQSLGNIDQNEMYTVFNMGIGMALVIDQQSISNTQKIIDSMGLSSTEIGTIQANGTGSVRLI
ncbi:MAG: AIR synthase-related protein, partial [Acidimicrobiales bacterium]|nr:AIR synthase-related protein [Acidimicrobiales bacterium]